MSLEAWTRIGLLKVGRAFVFIRHKRSNRHHRMRREERWRTIMKILDVALLKIFLDA